MPKFIHEIMIDHILQIDAQMTYGKVDELKILSLVDEKAPSSCKMSHCILNTEKSSSHNALLLQMKTSDSRELNNLKRWMK